MDWICNPGSFTESELSKVFKYEEKPSTVVRISQGDSKPVVSTLENDHEWKEWFNKDHPVPDGSSSGLVLLLARRTGEAPYPKVKKVTSDEWLEEITNSRSKELNMYDDGPVPEAMTKISNGEGQRNLRTLPFTRELFKEIAQKFYIPRSISRTISRADIPSISVAQVDSDETDNWSCPAYVYSCRTSNDWDMDLALSATFFPACRLTFAIIFGCPISVEERVLTRLNSVSSEAVHPMLVPGIFVELERARHVSVIEQTIDELEMRIYEVQSSPSEDSKLSQVEKTKRYEAKRSAWLNTTYIRNQLINWTAQLEKLEQHVKQLNHNVFGLSNERSSLMHDDSQSGESFCEDLEDWDMVLRESLWEAKTLPKHRRNTSSSKHYEEKVTLCSEKVDELGYIQQAKPPNSGKENKIMRRVGTKIKLRIEDIIREYNTKIRDCNMRVDGMSMATQWAQGETNVEIALATSRDSQHMRSIALVTMIFLPGTFFAGVFSTGLFNWPQGDSIVSKCFWIYVVITFISTLATVGCWWFFGVYRGHERVRTKVC